jgi:hypothetical protein
VCSSDQRLTEVLGDEKPIVFDKSPPPWPLTLGIGPGGLFCVDCGNSSKPACLQ